VAAVVTKNADESRYELRLNDRVVGVADYTVDGDRIIFPHTEIDPSMRGHGFGAQLVRGALDDVRRSGGKVVAHCWFVAQYINDHPAYAELVA
jgi:predicted GNAT family acetyltransferase